MMQWRKLGWIFSADGREPWLTSHAMIPTVERFFGSVVRIHFSPRDHQNRSNVGWLDVDLQNPTKVLRVSRQPVLSHGELGGFDDSGALASWFIEHDGRTFMYYIGYNIGATVQFRNYIGLAVSCDRGAAYVKQFRAGIIDRTHVDPLLAVTPCVLKEGDLWRMWYTSGVRWEAVEGARPRHYYHIKYAESDNGIDWVRTGRVCIDFGAPSEYAIARPSVLKVDNSYHMWFCCRGEKYRLGYARSADGLNWSRDDSLAGLTVSASGWDSEMIAYPFVFEHGGRIYMLYNGNGYGAAGFGIAVLETPLA